MQDFRVTTFLTVCKTMNYTRAARDLNLSQPAVSQHIAYLEKVYQARLFEYSNKKLTLTKAGRMLQNAFATVSHDDALLRARISSLDQGKSVKLAVGMTLTAGEYLLANPLCEYLAAHPEYVVRIYSGDTAQLIALLDEGVIDCAFVEGFFDRNNYQWDIYAREKFACVCGAFNPLASGVCEVEDLLDQPLFVREEGSGTRAVLERFLAARNLSLSSFEKTSVVESLNMIKVFVEHDLGISFLYEAAIERELEKNTLRRITINNCEIAHDISFVRLKNSVFEHEYQEFFEGILTRRGA